MTNALVQSLTRRCGVSTAMRSFTPQPPQDSGNDFGHFPLTLLLLSRNMCPLGAGGTSSTSSSLSPSPFFCASVFSRRSFRLCLVPLLCVVLRETIAQHALRLFWFWKCVEVFDSHPSGDLSQLCRLTPCYFVSGPGGSQSGNDGTGSDTISSTTRPHSSGSLQAPLVTVSPRGDGGWTHGGVDMDGAPVTAVPVRRGDARPCPCVFSPGRSLV